MTWIISFGAIQKYFWPNFNLVSVIILLILFSILIATGFLIAFIWSIRNNQFEDVCTPSMRILTDDIQVPQENRNEDL